MDEHDQANTRSDQFRAFRRALHLESPLEFAVVLIVVVCLFGAGVIWLRASGGVFSFKHAIWALRHGGNSQPVDNGAGPKAAQTGSGSLAWTAQTAPAAQGTIKITKQKPVGTTNSALPNGLEIVLLPDRIMTPAAMKLKFTGEVGEIHSSIDSAEVLDAQSGILVANPDTVVLEWRTPPFGPFAPLLLTIFSKDKIKLESAVSIPYRYPYEGGDLK
jgi:hypothetical protein